jgi:microsomal dipeptidase-like Zn-dependent dipeptidase
VRARRLEGGREKWPNLKRALLQEGYSKSDIQKIYGENTLRLMAQVEKIAAGSK